MSRLLLPLVLLSLGTACLTSEEMHCVQPGDDPEACYDLYDINGGIGLAVRASLSNLCLIIGSKPKAGECPTDDLVAGCMGDEQEAYSYIEWTYASDEVATPDDVFCNSDQVKVGPDRQPITTTPVDTDPADTDTDA